MHRGDEVAGIVGSNDMSCRAVLTRIPKAEGGSWHKVGARRVDRGINGGELVCRDMISSRNSITNISRLDGVRSSASSGERRLHEER